MAYSGQAVFGGTTDPVTGSWTNATTLNSTVVTNDITGYGVVAASFVITGTITQGTAIFEVSDDGGTTWCPISGLQTGSNNQASNFVLTGSSASFEFATGAYNLFRVRLNPVILGSGSVAIRLSAEAFPFLTAVAITGTTNVSITGTNAVTVASTVQIQGDNPSGQSNIGNPVKIGAAFNTTQPTVTNGQIVDAQATARGAIIVATGVDAFNSAIFAGSTALTATGTSLNVNITGGSTSGTQYTGSPAVASGSVVSTLASGYDGANIRPILTSTTGQQHVIADSGSTTAVTGTVAVTQSTSPWVVSLTSTTITGTVAVTQSTSPWVVAGAAASGAAKSGSPVQIGGVFNTTQPTVTTGQAVEAQSTARGAQIVATGADTFNVTVNAPLPAGTNVIGHVITDSGSTTVVTGTVAVTQSTSPWVVSLTSTTITGTVAVTQSTSPWTIQGDSASGVAKAGNPVQVGGVFNTTQPTVTTGQTVEAQMTARGAQIVATGTDAFAVNASQTGTWNIGTVTTLTSITNAVTVAQGTAANLNATVVGTGTFAVQAAQSGTWTVQQGSAPWTQNLTQVAGATLGTPQTFGTAPTGIVIGTSSDIYVAGTRARSNQTTTAAGVQDINLVGVLGATMSVTNPAFTSITDGTNKAAVKPASTASVATDPALVVTMSPNTISVPVTQAPASSSSTSVATWTSATALNTAVTLISGTFNYDALIVTLNQGSTITAGQLTFEVSNDNSNWVAVTGVNASQFGTFAENGIYFLTQSTYAAGFFNMTSWQYFRVRLSTVITGTGNVVIGYAAQSAGSPPVVVRQPHNFGRTFVSITQDQIAAPTTEALTTMTINKGGNVTTGTSYTVANGKTLRLQSVDAIVSSSSGTQPVKVRLRSAAAVSATSPILWATYFSATTSSLGNVTQTWPDGLEIASGQQIGISMLDTNSTSNGVTITLVGYEF